eukprot:TRINITY_DN129_c0_g1_i5.p1 TRINITY_DN129_c0_g1~~TRINITY_DN129_c0_g1_i5.p1  ORF type:complete len:445 (+),score=125.86 TRINITY_DN129_c0_g1_i5:147-1481(+)
MRNSLVVLLVVIGLVALTQGSSAPPSGKRTLVLVQSNDIKVTHSTFFKSLEAQGYKLTYSNADSDSIKLHKYGDYLYDNLIIFAPSVEVFGGGVGVDAILKFIDDGHNVLIAADNKLAGPVRDLALELGVEFDEEGTHVIDHLNFDSSDFNRGHTLLTVSEAAKDAIPVIVSKPLQAPVLWRGIGATLTESNRLVFPILSGSSSAYSARLEQVISKKPQATGSKVALVAGLQARNNARVVISGSIDLFSNKLVDSPVSTYGAAADSKKFSKSGNEAFILDIVQWAFKEKGVIVASEFTHKKTDGTTNAVYRIRDDLDFSVNIQEWSNGKWVPFKSNEVQVEFVRVDPYIRATLKHDEKGNFFTTFKLPDTYGVFTFKLVHKRKGYSFLPNIETVKVRPFRHNEYERYIVAAYPYYAAAFSMLFGFSIFGFFFLYHRPTDNKKSQ